jgi:hypothetical protein
MKRRRTAIFPRPGALFAAALFIAVSWGTVFAGRPLITDDTSTQGKGGYLLEVGIDYGRDNSDGTKVNRTGATVEMDYGIGERVDLNVVSAYQVMQIDDQGDRSTPQGITDTMIELKWRFYENTSGLSFAVKPGLIMPTGNYTNGTGGGDYRFGTGDVKPRLYLVGTRQMGPFAFHLNLGYIRNLSRYSAQQDLWHASLAAEWRATKKLRFVCNTGIDTNMDKGTTEDPAFVLGGVIYALTEKIDLDFGIRYGLAEPGYDTGFTSGISVKF